MTSPLRIAFAGTPAFAVPTLRTLLASDHELAGVITQPDRPAGRGRRMVAPPVKAVAEAAGLPVLQPERLRREDLANGLGGNLDVLVVVAYGQLLTGDILTLPRHGAINVHASLLPRWRGAAPIARAILAGDERTGVSIMQMALGLDTGPVLARTSTAITPTASAATLHDALAQLGADALIPVLADLPAALAAAEPQTDAAATHAAKLTKAEARLDWSRPVGELDRAVRAFQPWPVAHTLLRGDMLRIHTAAIAGDQYLAAPGTVVAATADGIDVAAGNGTLRLLEVQAAGGRAMAAGAFARARALVGECLGQAS